MLGVFFPAGPEIQPVPGRGPEHDGKVQHLDAARRRHPRAVRAPIRVGHVPWPEAADRRRGHGGGEQAAPHLLGRVVVGRGAELGVGFDPEALGVAEAASRRAAVLAAAARPAGEVRGRAQGMDVRALPEAVSIRAAPSFHYSSANSFATHALFVVTSLVHGFSQVSGRPGQGHAGGKKWAHPESGTCGLAWRGVHFEIENFHP
jgi:hypothetical protein